MALGKTLEGLHDEFNVAQGAGAGLGWDETDIYTHGFGWVFNAGRSHTGLQRIDIHHGHIVWAGAGVAINIELPVGWWRLVTACREFVGGVRAAHGLAEDLKIRQNHLGRGVVGQCGDGTRTVFSGDFGVERFGQCAGAIVEADQLLEGRGIHITEGDPCDGVAGFLAVTGGPAENCGAIGQRRNGRGMQREVGAAFGRWATGLDHLGCWGIATRLD
jgi:hypothetical protein